MGRATTDLGLAGQDRRAPIIFPLNSVGGVPIEPRLAPQHAW
jgi:hypothetical protein